MSDSAQAEWVDRLRQEFDRSFQRAHQTTAQESIEVLRLQVGREEGSHLVRVDALSLLQRLPTVRPLPGAADQVLGLCSVRGRVVPVFCLAQLLDLPASESPAWLVGVGKELDYALAFTELQALQRIELGVLNAASSSGRAHQQTLIEQGHTLSLIDIGSISSALGQDDAAQPHRSIQHA
ncbi:chemotaxis protein CheW [Pseudomarimonas arenosa]|uniref:Chemotaxis protein CheW n=1 Tax=Pseudomarimonas arenosa TaxID=2774145 RepID=A0AAW3ZL55_9GAMM|nr:chemotaxis protein CheW [Pseudomarimonas arenosa]MBD8526771.1 chemotaxis protein CheW [Pseudomarimonas arenosa]